MQRLQLEATDAARALGEEIPVLRPQLPTAGAILPYLRRIDEARTYTNFGPLVLEFERRMGALLGSDEERFASASSGTAALEAAILAVAGRVRAARPLALLPSYTFVATVVAVENCGYQPFLLDVDAETWALDPDRVAEHPLLANAGVVVPVAPYGRASDQRPWSRFVEQTGVPVVIDAAAGVESVAAGAGIGAVPVTLSFHATKSFGTGEGGGIVCDDPALVTRIRQCANFGFLEARDSEVASINGKMSEYHAAVGLAELDGWDAKRARFEQVHASYARHAADAGLTARMPGPPSIASCYRLFLADDGQQAARVAAALDAANIGYRRWYGDGIHRQANYAGAGRDRLPVTEALAPCTLGLPSAPDLADASIVRVLDAVLAGLAHG